MLKSLEMLLCIMLKNLNSMKVTLLNALLTRKEEEEFDALLDEQLADDMEELEKRLDKEIELEKEKIAKIQALKNEEDEKDRQREEEKRKRNEQILFMSLSATSSVLNSLASLASDDFEKQKKIKIASAVATTIQGMISAYMGGVATIPVPIPAGVALGAAMAAVVGLAGFANIKKMASAKPGGGTTSTPRMAGGGGGGGALSAPSFSQVQPLTAGDERLAGAIENETGVVTKAFVVSADMTSQQELDRRIESNATI